MLLVHVTPAKTPLLGTILAPQQMGYGFQLHMYIICTCTYMCTKEV
jgi:hypothetical protein